MAIGDAGASSISVAVRVRPFTIREAAQITKCEDGTVFLGDGSLAAAPTPKLQPKGIRSVIKVVDERCLVFDPPEDNPVQRFSRSVVPSTGKRVKDQTFGFDRVFDDTATQVDVYEHTTRNLLDSVLDGYNATVFAYGATGCGKTHTITGTSQQPGIIFLTMQELFEKIGERSDEKHTEVSLSYLEIYNETIRDLLVPGGSKQGLMLREDANQTVSVSGLSSHHPKDVQEVMDMIVKGNEYRTMSPTEANATSSRSHAVLQINVVQKDRNADVNEPHTMATLSIIDLAGSERASATKNRGERLIEGANINKSLLALGSCINALCDPRKRNHVPYRNSKLTRLLKFSLGGNCKTVMIVCISPSSQHFDETQNTLRYANRAKNIQTKVSRNVFNVNRHVKDFLVKIDEQMALINELRAQQKDSEATAFVKFRKQSEKREGFAKEGLVRIRAAYENSAAERLDKLNDMKRLRQVEKRIGMLSIWIAAFDNVCEMRDEVDMPESLSAMRKTAQGIMLELENSRQHFHQKLNKNTWDRNLESALQNSIRQLNEMEGQVDGFDVSCLTREVEILRATANREALQEIVDLERGGDLALMQVLLSAQFEIISSLNDILSMREDEAVQHAKTVLGRLLNTCSSAASQIIKPDGSLATNEKFAPSKRGTPKKKKIALFASESQPVVPPMAALAIPQVFSSPMKSSPKRRKAAPVKKGLNFTPKKKSAPKRSVRWRDDTEAGALADFEKTPQKISTSTPEISSAEQLVLPPAMPSYLEQELATESSGSSPIPVAPQFSLDIKKNNRFQAGFLSRKPSSPNSATHQSSSAEDSDHSPLRTIDPARASNRPSLLTNQLRENTSDSQDTSDGENASLQGEDGIKIRKAMRRASLAHAHGSPIEAKPRPRLRSRSPPVGGRVGSPPSENQLFSASQARRMVKSDKPSISAASVLSPRTAAVMKNARRITIDGKHAVPTPGVQAMRVVSNSGSMALPRVRESVGVSAKGVWR